MKILQRINILLGVISLALAGCHTKQAAVADSEVARQPLKYGCPPEVVALYGARTPVLEVPEEELQQDTASTTTDTVVLVPPREEKPPIMCKYGVPFPREKQ